MNLPPNVPLYIPILSSVFAIGIVKQAFGGLDKTGKSCHARGCSLFAWTKEMTTWHVPFMADALATATHWGRQNSTHRKFGSGHITTSILSSTFRASMEILQSLPNDILRTDVTYFNLFGFKGGCIVRYRYFYF